MNYSQELIKRIERPGRCTTVLGAAVTIVAMAFFIKGVIKRSKRNKNVGGREIPSPKGEYFFIGHIPLMTGRPAETVTQWHHELGPLVKVHMGAQTWVFVGEPEAAHEILSTKGSITSGRPDFTFLTKVNSPDDRGVAFVNYGKRWKETRAAVMEVLSHKSMENLTNVVNKEEELFVNLMKEYSKKNDGVDPANFCRLAAMNVTLAVAFGIPGSKDVSEPLYKEADYILNRIVEFASFAHDYSVMFPSLKFLDVLFSKQKQMEDFRDKIFHPFLRRIIKSALESKEDNLAKKLDQVKDVYQLDELNIIAIMSEVLAAGIGTTSDSTSWVIAILCNYPDVQNKLCVEIDEFMKKHGREPAFVDREELPYFMAVAKECVRFRPSKDFGLPHRATEDVVYRDYIIPKGTVLFASLNTIHRDPNFYQDGDKFIPERYQDDTKTMYASSRGALKSRDHFTFGWGRRICPGIFVAENQIFLTITKIMASCTIEPVLSPDKEKIYPNLHEYVGTTATVHPLPYKVRLVERANRVLV